MSIEINPLLNKKNGSKSDRITRTQEDLLYQLSKQYKFICDLFVKYEVPSEFDLISIDIDRNDFFPKFVKTLDYQTPVKSSETV